MKDFRVCGIGCGCVFLRFRGSGDFCFSWRLGFNDVVETSRDPAVRDVAADPISGPVLVDSQTDDKEEDLGD